MDGFAQTREPDDLFDDDFTPIDKPAQQETSLSETTPQRPRNDRPSRGRGKGAVTKSTSDPSPQTTTKSTNVDPAPTNITTEPDQTPKPPTAVRGDRSATGGNIKPKLTEDELSARLEAAKLNNVKREEAHRLAEADEASFQQREALASQKRKEEGAARRAMDQEREKNRLRKLGARGGREWDEGKQEEELSASRGSQYRRGANGVIAYRGGREQGGYDNVDGGSAIRGRGRIRAGASNLPVGTPGQRGDGNTARGGRGGGGGDRGRGRGGRGRGSSDVPAVSSAPTFPAVSTEREFPSLPASSNTQPKADIDNKQKDAPIKGADIVQATKGQSWADEVNTAKEPAGG